MAALRLDRDLTARMTRGELAVLRRPLAMPVQGEAQACEASGHRKLVTSALELLSVLQPR